MMENTKKIIMESQFMKDWPEIGENFVERICNYRNFEKEDIEKAHQNMFLLLKEMAGTAIEYGKFKDTWEFGFVRLEGWGQETIVKSIKTGHVFKIGINPECIYTTSEIDNSQNLKYMENEFWETVIQLSKFRKSKFEEHTFSNPEHRKTVIMKLISTYINSEQTEKNIGIFDIEWDIDKSLEEILKEFCQVFKYLYRLDYMLWKVDDLKRKRTYKTKGEEK